MGRSTVSQHDQLYRLAEKMHDTADGFLAYDYAKCVWLGAPEREQRLGGDHPWPTRQRNGEHYVYSTPVLAAVSPEQESLLYVGKDPWKPDDDPAAWLVAERPLFGDREIEHQVLASSVDRGRQLWLQIAPHNISNMPPLLRHNLYRQPRSAQIALSGRLDRQYALNSAVFHEGALGQTLYQDYEALEAMIGVVSEMRGMRSRQMEHAMGRHGLGLFEDLIAA